MSSSSKRNYGALASAMMVGLITAIGFAGSVHASVPVTCGAAVAGAAVGAAGWAFPNQHAAIQSAADAFLPPTLAGVVGQVLDRAAPPVGGTQTLTASLTATEAPATAVPASPAQAVPLQPPAAAMPTVAVAPGAAGVKVLLPPIGDPGALAALKQYAEANGLGGYITPG